MQHLLHLHCRNIFWHFTFSLSSALDQSQPHLPCSSSLSSESGSIICPFHCRQSRTHLHPISIFLCLTIYDVFDLIFNLLLCCVLCHVLLLTLSLPHAFKVEVYCFFFHCPIIVNTNNMVKSKLPLKTYQTSRITSFPSLAQADLWLWALKWKHRIRSKAKQTNKIKTIFYLIALILLFFLIFILFF